jgi:OOP family OmpA-OmpF porin
MTRRAALSAAFALALPLAAGAAPVALELPGATQRAAGESAPAGSYRVPLAPFDGREVATLRADGALTREVWHTTAEGLTTLSLLGALRPQIEAAGFEVLLDCEAAECGGFDFRYGIDLIGEPEMHVDLGDYRFLSARRPGTDGPEYLSLMISRSFDTGYVQMTHVGPGGAAAPQVAKSSKSAAATPAPPEVGDVAGRLALHGVAVLDDLSFATGSARLEPGGHDSLVALADYLRDHPGHRVALVGHTDFAGTLDVNVALSRKRAEAVRDYLVAEHGIDPARLEAQGIGYLAPRSSNMTEDGRSENRRVEVVLVATR